MAHEIKIKREKQIVTGFRSLATAYQEISLYKMRLLRNSILRNREFLEELSEIFFDVKMSYVSILELLLRHQDKKGQKHFAGVMKNGRQIDVLITANDRLYGTIVNDVFESFYKDIQPHSSDLFIIGKVGRQLFDAKKTGRKYAYFEISETDNTMESLLPIIEHLIPYEKVIVYHGKFMNVVSQKPTAINLSGDTPADDRGKEHVYKFLFEPKVDEILHFFQTQVFASLFNQSVREGEFSRHASRITAMEEVLKNIEERLIKIKLREKKIQMVLTNKKQLQLLSGMSLWEED